jgi:HD-GYP domain-containing protein (c-di-GMP phosphodiesterase class II)
MDQLIKSLAIALEIVEGELLGASTHHGKRIATLSAAMGKYLGMDDAALSALTTCALLHDSALTEYILAERQGYAPALSRHCQIGQNNAERLLYNVNVEGYVLHHHERADGRGPFGRKEGEYSLGAELIAIADMLDVSKHLQTVVPSFLPVLRKEIANDTGTRFTKRAAEALLNVLDEEMLAKMRDSQIVETAKQSIPAWTVDIGDAAILCTAGLIARIIDYKSEFTQRHSTQIANRAWLMGGYYGYDKSLRVEFYLAAALHDLGKLGTPTDILEKPGKLTDAEFVIIKDHIRLTYELLRCIAGLENICEWASSHHEKLNGRGYHRGLPAERMDFNSRLMACLDIYQAVSETRPYHAGRSHEETMPLLYSMADKGLIDGDIVKDLDAVMAEYSNRDIPAPEADFPDAPFSCERA